MMTDGLLNTRASCPCCGYPTLPERNADEICELCNWEDDGQDDADADVVRGGPNGDYSLAEARANFRKYLVMYSPDRDTRLTGCDTEVELRAKRALMQAFDEWRTATDPVLRTAAARRASVQESILRAELERTMREYEQRTRNGGSA